MRHIGNNILKETLRLKILWTWLKIRANSFVNTLPHIMKRKSVKVPSKLSPAKQKKNETPHFKEHCIKIDVISLVVIRFLFSQTNPVFKSSSIFIDILVSFSYSLFTFLLFDFIFILRIFKFTQCLYAFFNPLTAGRVKLTPPPPILPTLVFRKMYLLKRG